MLACAPECGWTLTCSAPGNSASARSWARRSTTSTNSQPPIAVRPKVVVAGASAYPRTWDFERMAAIAHGVGALLFVDMAHVAGLVAAGLHPSPFPHADLVTTTTHKTLRGPRGGIMFARADLPEGVDRADFPALGKNTLAQAIDKSVFPGIQGGPLMHVIAAKAVAFQLAMTDDFRQDQARTIENAAVLAETVAAAGARLISGGTDNHLALVDVTPLGVTGREAEALLDDVGITVNKNAIPFDQNPPNVASGIRIGTPATTTRGFGPAEMREVGRMIVDAIRAATTPPSTTASGPRSGSSSPASPCRGSRGTSTDPRMRLIPTFGEVLPLLIVTFTIAMVLSVGLTPLVRRLAIRLDAVDAPNHRRVNASPVPRGGGIAVAVSFLAVAVATLVANDRMQFVNLPFTISPQELAGLFVGGAVATAIGFLDDYFQLRARWQLLGQVAVGCSRSAPGSPSPTRQPVRARARSCSRARSRPGSRWSGSSG